MVALFINTKDFKHLYMLSFFFLEIHMTLINQVGGGFAFGDHKHVTILF